jgi:hypothetical protein
MSSTPAPGPARCAENRSTASASDGTQRLPFPVPLRSHPSGSQSSGPSGAARSTRRTSAMAPARERGVEVVEMTPSAVRDYSDLVRVPPAPDWQSAA